MDTAETPEERALWDQAKKLIRQRMRALRAALPASAWQARSGKICARLSALPEYQAARSIALFWPIDERREVDLRSLDASARAAGKLVYYPFMDPLGAIFRTGFRRVDDTSALIERGRGFSEPPNDAAEAGAGSLDLIVVPALAAAPSGHRLGYGAGFYDQTLAEFCPPALTLVVLYDFQLLSELPQATHDIACSLIVTDERTLNAADARQP